MHFLSNFIILWNMCWLSCALHKWEYQDMYTNYYSIHSLDSTDSKAYAFTNPTILPSLTSSGDYCTNYRATCSNLKQTHTHTCTRMSNPKSLAFQIFCDLIWYISGYWTWLCTAALLNIKNPQEAQKSLNHRGLHNAFIGRL